MEWPYAPQTCVLVAHAEVKASRELRSTISRSKDITTHGLGDSTLQKPSALSFLYLSGAHISSCMSVDFTEWFTTVHHSYIFVALK